MRSSVIVYQRQGHFILCLCAFYFVVSMEQTGLKRSSVHVPSSLTTAATSTQRDFKSNISASDRLLFNTNKRNYYSATQLEMFHLLQLCLYHEMFKKTSLFNDVGVAFTGEYPICPLTRQAQMHVSDSYVIYFHI